MQQITFRKAQLADIDAISALAEKVWRKHYIHIISNQQIDYMLNWMYSPQSLAEQINQKKHQFYLAFIDDILVAYASFSASSDHAYFIHKLYVDTDIQKSGIGSMLLKYVLGCMSGLKELRLTVNRANYTAINFYFKNGFVIEKTEDFDIGNNYFMNDFVMLYSKK